MRNEITASLLSSFVVAKQISQRIDSSTLASISPDDLNVLLSALVSTITTISVGSSVGNSPSSQYLHQLVMQIVCSFSPYWDYWTQIPIKEGSCTSEIGNHLLSLILFLRAFAKNEKPLAEPFDRSVLQVNVAFNDPQDVNSMQCREDCVEDVFCQERFVSLGRFYGYKAILINLCVRLFQFLKKDSDLFILAVSLLGVEPYRGRNVETGYLTESDRCCCWRVLVQSSSKIHLKSVLLRIIEFALEDPSGFDRILFLWVVQGEVRWQLRDKFFQCAVPPFRFNVKRPRDLPFSIRYVKDLPMRGRVGAKNVYFNDANEGITVEQIALEYYEKEFGYEGIHDEGQSLRELWNGALSAGQLFVLLLWDFIYFPVPFAFQNRSQTIPIDYGSSLFYEARKPFIDEWLAQLSLLSDAQIQSEDVKML